MKGKVASFTTAVSAMMDQPLLYGTCIEASPPSSVLSTICKTAKSVRWEVRLGTDTTCC